MFGLDDFIMSDAIVPTNVSTPLGTGLAALGIIAAIAVVAVVLILIRKKRK